MPISGVVFNLTGGAAGEAALEALRSRSELTLGSRAGNLVAAALDTPDVPSSRALHDWILEQPGVSFVDVVYVNFEEDKAEPQLRPTDANEGGAALPRSPNTDGQRRLPQEAGLNSRSTLTL